MATIQQIQLVAPVQLGATDAPLYTTPALTTAKIGRAVFSNTDTAPHSITINITTGTSTTANQFINARVLSPGETYVSPELAGAVLPAGSVLRGLCSAAAVVNLTVSGMLVTGQ